MNHGRVSSHVSKDSKERYAASFIPHDPGRHRVDVKFNGEKLAQTPVFVEVSSSRNTREKKFGEDEQIVSRSSTFGACTMYLQHLYVEKENSQTTGELP